MKVSSAPYFCRPEAVRIPFATPWRQSAMTNKLKMNQADLIASAIGYLSVKSDKIGSAKAKSRKFWINADASAQ